MALSQASNLEQLDLFDETSESSHSSENSTPESSSTPQSCRKGPRRVSRRRRSALDAPRSAHDFVAFKTSTVTVTHPSQHASGGVTVEQPTDFRAAQTRWRLSVPVNNVTKGSSFDPFAASVIPMNDAIFSILQYAKVSMMRGAYGYRLDLIPCGLRPMAQVYQSAQEYVFEHVLQHEYLLFPFLAAFSQRYCDMVCPDTSTSLQHPEWYLHQGTRAVRNAIKENIDDASALGRISTGVCFLVCSTGMMFRCKETRIHIQAFMKFLPYLDTKDVVGYWKLETIATLDVFVSVALGLIPVLKVPTSDPGPLSPSEKTQMRKNLVSIQESEAQLNPLTDTNSIAENNQTNNFFDIMQNPAADLTMDLGLGFEEALTAGTLHSSMTGPLSKLMECLTVAKVVWRAPKYATKRETQWLCRRSQAVLHELLSMPGARKNISSTYLGRYAECIRLTLIIMMTSALYRLYRSRSMQSKRLRAALSDVLHERLSTTPHPSTVDEDMTNAIERTDLSTTRESDELLLWMLFIGYWASSDNEDTAWFADGIVHLTQQYLQPRNFNDLESMMMKFLYSRTAQRSSLASVAVMISEEKPLSSEHMRIVEISGGA